MTKLRKGIVTLSSAYLELCEEWDYDKNAPLTPETVGKGF
jgi:hypothetical protein